MAEPKKKMDRRSRRKMMEICRRLKEKTKGKETDDQKEWKMEGEEISQDGFT